MTEIGMNIEIIDPPMQDMVFLEGEQRSVTYQIKNNCENPVKDITFEAYTIIKNEDNTIRNTFSNYASVVNVPVNINPGEIGKVDVIVDIPTKYTEKKVLKSGKERKAAFIIKTKCHVIEYIEE